LQGSVRAAGDPRVDSDARWSSAGVLRHWIPEILLLAVTTAAGLRAAGRWLTPLGDPGGWWTLLHRLGEGERLYRDIYLQYTPLSPYLLALLGRVFGLSPTSFLLMNWIPAILLALLLLRAARPYLSERERLAVLGLLLALGVFAPGRAHLVLPYSPAAVHALIFSVLALLLLQRTTPGLADALAAGGLAGLAFCSKQEIGLVAVCALSAPVWGSGTRGPRWLVASLTGFLCVAGAGLLVVFASAPFESLRYDSHFWPIGTIPEAWTYHAGITTGLSVAGWPRRLVGAALSFLYAAALIGLLALLMARDPRVRQPLLYLLLSALLIGGAVEGTLLGRHAQVRLLSVPAALALALLAWLDRARPGRDFLVALGLFAGLVAARTAFSGNVRSPYAGLAGMSVALVWALLLFCFLPTLWPGGAAAAQLARRIWFFALLGFAAWGTWIGMRDLAKGPEVIAETPRGRVWIPEPAVPLFAAFGQNLRPGERALVLPEPNAVEALFRLRSDTPLLYHTPGCLDLRAEERLLRRYRQGGPEVVVIFDRPTAEWGVAPFGRGFGQRLAGWLESNYSAVASPPGAVILRPKP
jgi:hypothetical protein